MFLLLCLLFIVGYTEITNSFACLGKYFLSSNSSKIILNNILVQRIFLFFTFTNFLLLYCRKLVRVRLYIYPQGLKITQWRVILRWTGLLYTFLTYSPPYYGQFWEIVLLASNSGIIKHVVYYSFVWREFPGGFSL